MVNWWGWKRSLRIKGRVICNPVIGILILMEATKENKAEYLDWWEYPEREGKRI